MKKLVVPTIQTYKSETDDERSDKLFFVGEHNTCGGDLYCAGRRVIENWCNALNSKKGYRGLDDGCVMTMIKIQLNALNQLLGIKKGARDRQEISAGDVETVLEEVRQENRVFIGNNEPEMNRREAFNLVTDLLLEKLRISRELNNRFFGMMSDQAETKSFKDLDPQLLKRIKSAMLHSAGLLFKNEAE